MSYYLNDGTEASAEQIKNAFAKGNAVLVHGNRDGGTSTGLMLDGNHYDTRGECHSVWDEAWTRTPKTEKEALEAAYARTGK